MTFTEWKTEVLKRMANRVDDFQIDMFFEDIDMHQRDFENGVSVEDAANSQIEAYDWWLNYGQYF